MAYRVPGPFPIQDLKEEWLVAHPGQNLPAPFANVVIAGVPLLEEWQLSIPQSQFMLRGRNLVRSYGDANNNL